jgi:phage shock protein A
MTQKMKVPAMATTMNRPRTQVDRQQTANSSDAAWHAPSLDDFERRIDDLELMADWRDELTARIARETLIFEFADYTRREEFDALEAEVSLFNQVCRAITASNEDLRPEREAA